MCSCTGSETRITPEFLGEQAMEEAALAAHANGEKWHFHVLAPDCVLNPRPGAYVFLLELTDQQRTVASVHETHPVDVNKRLLAMLHGEDALADKTALSGELQETETTALDLIEAASVAKRRWHHHVMFPACAFNGSGRWRIAIEVDGALVRTLDYESEPALLLNRIERLYFKIQ